jgi:acetylornithine deacetylase/succinyl-diaminopimelate desuccinylase-like protein
MSIDPFSGEERDGKIWGRGTTDTKGSMAAILWTLWEMRERLASLEYEIWFVGLMGEETGQHGSKAFVKRYLTQADAARTFALIGEPTAPAIVHTHKGSCWLTLATRGHAVHASTPQAGENAIYKMMEVIRYLREEMAPRFAAIQDPVLGSPTLSVGTIQGGSKTNIVPDRCEITVDIRTVPAQYEGIASLSEAFLAELKTVCPDLEGEARESFPLWTDPNHPLIGLLERQGGRPGGAPWFCDAAIFSAAGVPAVAYGPGSIEQAHIKDEFLSVEVLKAGVDSYRRFLQELV